jgi:hypothetical protein
VDDLKTAIKSALHWHVDAVEIKLYQVSRVQCPRQTNFSSHGDILTGRCRPGRHRQDSSEPLQNREWLSVLRPENIRRGTVVLGRVGIHPKVVARSTPKYTSHRFYRTSG